jgi:hypothetical protein
MASTASVIVIRPFMSSGPSIRIIRSPLHGLRLRDEYYVELITVKDKGGDPSAARRRMELTRDEVLQKLAAQVWNSLGKLSPA